MPTTFLRPILTPAAERARSEAQSSAAGATTAAGAISAAGATPAAGPLVSLTTDFGERDPWPAICRGVILGIAPHARVLDISHEVTKFSILDGALALWAALPYLPIGVHVAVIDPGVGTSRRAVGIRVARGDTLVGPDNGLLLPASERLGGIVAVHALESGEYRLPVVSASFHGRDVFAPAGAHLALGVPLEAFGPAIDPSDLVRLDLPRPTVLDGSLGTRVTYVDTFGNVKLAGAPADLESALGRLAVGDPLRVEVPPHEPALDDDRLAPAPRAIALTWQQTFGSVPPGEPLLYEDSHGRLCIAIDRGSAAATLGLRVGDEVSVRRIGEVAPAR